MPFYLRLSRNRKWICCAAAVVLLGAASHAQEIPAQADAFIQAFPNEQRFQGSVLLARDGNVLFRKSYGMANADWDIPNTPDTKFRLGSITKQFTATLILQLVEEGKIKLDDSIRKYYAAAPESWQPITIHHLLSHESGIPSYTGIPGFFQKMAGVPYTPLQLIELTRDRPLEFTPGTKMAYDNSGYILLGYVIEQVTGKTYEQQLHSRILDPLGMADSGFEHNTAILKHRAEGYENENGKLQRAAYLDMTIPYAAGSMYSTVDDLLKWDQALYGTKILSAASKEKMWKSNLNDYAYGWFIVNRYGEHSFEHGGGINGFSTMIIRVPDKKLLAVALSNMESESPGLVAAGLLALALGKPAALPKHRTAITLPVEQMKPFEGVYVLNPSFKLTIKVVDGHLTGQATGQGALPLDPMSPTRFFNDTINLELEFQKDGLMLYQNGSAMKFTKE